MCMWVPVPSCRRNEASTPLSRSRCRAVAMRRGRPYPVARAMDKLRVMGEESGQSPAARISNGIVQLLAEHYGRGPTKARTFMFDRFVVCVLEDLLTRSEQTMVANGRET